MANETLVIIPTYNEAQNLPLIVERVLAANDGVDILVVDDNSPDGTGEIADRLAAAAPRPDAVLDPAGYFDVLTASGLAADVWETTYLHVLSGEDPYVAGDDDHHVKLSNPSVDNPATDHLQPTPQVDLSAYRGEDPAVR